MITSTKFSRLDKLMYIKSCGYPVKINLIFFFKIP